MSQENLDVVRRGYEDLNSRDVDAWLEVFHPDAEMYDLAGGPVTPARRGHAALREWVATMDETWEDGRHEPHEFIDAGRFVVVGLNARGRRRGTGLPVDIVMFHVFEMRGRKVERGRAYLDRGEALAAAGLRE